MSATAAIGPSILACGILLGLIVEGDDPLIIAVRFLFVAGGTTCFIFALLTSALLIISHRQTNAGRSNLSKAWMLVAVNIALPIVLILIAQ